MRHQAPRARPRPPLPLPPLPVVRQARLHRNPRPRLQVLRVQHPRVHRHHHRAHRRLRQRPARLHLHRAARARAQPKPNIRSQYERSDSISWCGRRGCCATNRVGGREDMTGTITGVPDMDNPQHNNFLFGGGSNPNDKNIVALLLWEDANEGLTAEDYWYLPRALISQLTWGIDNDTKLPMDWTANFGADSLFYRPRQVGTMPTATAATILNEGLPVGTTPA